MFRFATLVSLACLFSTAAVAEEAAGGSDLMQLAQIRPSLPATGNLVEPAVVAPPATLPAPPNLAARVVLAPRLLVRVDISEQTMNVVVDGVTRFTWKVSTAGRGYYTPTGMWTPYRMHVMWHSKKYDNAPMPHSIFFTGGYAIHATPHVKRLGTPASHGCVRLHPDNATELFALAKEYGPRNMRVVIQR